MSKRRAKYLQSNTREDSRHSTAKVPGVVCPSGKSGIWPNELAANLALRAILRKPPLDPNKPQPCRSYPCFMCGYWHLTSKPWMPEKPHVDLSEEFPELVGLIKEEDPNE